MKGNVFHTLHEALIHCAPLCKPTQRRTAKRLVPVCIYVHAYASCSLYAHCLCLHVQSLSVPAAMCLTGHTKDAYRHIATCLHPLVSLLPSLLLSLLPSLLPSLLLSLLLSQPYLLKTSIDSLDGAPPPSLDVTLCQKDSLERFVRFLNNILDKLLQSRHFFKAFSTLAFFLILFWSLLDSHLVGITTEDDLDPVILGFALMRACSTQKDIKERSGVLSDSATHASCQTRQDMQRRIAAMHHIPYTHTQVYTGMHDISCIQTIKRKCIETIAKGQLLHKLEASMLYLVGYYKAIQ